MAVPEGLQSCMQAQELVCSDMDNYVSRISISSGGSLQMLHFVHKVAQADAPSITIDQVFPHVAGITTTKVGACTYIRRICQHRPEAFDWKALSNTHKTSDTHTHLGHIPNAVAGAARRTWTRGGPTWQQGTSAQPLSASSGQLVLHLRWSSRPLR